MKIKLDDVLEAIELGSNEYEYYYNTETEETLMYADPLLTGIDDEELEDELEENYDKYIKLPTEFEINDYGIMEKFILSQVEVRTQNKLAAAIQKRGGFRRFKDMVYDMGIEKKWFDFQAEAYRKIAVEWCEINKIEYTE